MPSKIVDLSARSEIIRDEPFHVHFWECTPAEYKRFLGAPRSFIEKMGSLIPIFSRNDRGAPKNLLYSAGVHSQK